MNETKEDILNLYEFCNLENYKGDKALLKSLLDEIWQKRQNHIPIDINTSEETHYDRVIASEQKFITFKEDQIKSRNYVGVVKFEHFTINLLPKIFFNGKQENTTEQEVEAIQANILWWLSYCRKIRFPKYKSNLNSIKSNFFDILIFIFAQYTRESFSHCLLQAYDEVSNELSFMKGRLDVNSYITNNLSKGNWHKLSCTYDSFEFDNHFNRIVKYVAKLLFRATESRENKKLLSEILFILDEVSDVFVTYEDCHKVKLNPLFEDFNIILDYCKLFLANSITFSYKNQFKVFAFLLPMEYIFEDFFYGFFKKHQNGKGQIQNLSSQKSDLYLAKLFENNSLVKSNVFNMKHDIYFEHLNRKVIVDLKYKIAYLKDDFNNSQKYKHGVSQNDLYQVVSYAIRREVTEVYIVYPHTLSSQFGNDINGEKSVKFIVHDSLSGKDIAINIVKVPIIHSDFPNMDKNRTLQVNFINTEKILISQINKRLSLIQ
jgi:5-methylcytosine-specific restriction enzyme subunit McrC